MMTKTIKLVILLSLGILLGSVVTYAQITYGAKIPDRKGVYYTFGDYSLNLRIIDNNFHLYFLNEKGEVELAPAELEVSLRYESNKRVVGRKDGDPRRKDKETIRLVLDNDALGLWSPRYIKPPHQYWVTLTVITRARGQEDVVRVLSRQRLDQIADEAENFIEEHREINGQNKVVIYE